MGSLIDNGEEWLLPLLEFRDLLAETQKPETKHIYRDYKRRNGQVSYKQDGSIVRGPYRFDFCKQLLDRVLMTQKSIQERGPDPTLSLISEEELREIRRIWRLERQDMSDAVPDIYRRVYSRDLAWPDDDTPKIDEADAALLARLCEEHSVPPEMVMKLLNVELQLAGLRRRAGIYNRIDEVLGEEWRSEEEVLASAARCAQSMQKAQ